MLNTSIVNDTKEMTKITNYSSPDVETLEIEVEEGFILSGVEAPNFENENEI